VHPGAIQATELARHMDSSQWSLAFIAIQPGAAEGEAEGGVGFEAGEVIGGESQFGS
jgi:hypothetical protein